MNAGKRRFSRWPQQFWEEKKISEKLTKTLLNHVNCRVVALRSILRVICFCTDDATFDRCKTSWRAWFPQLRAYKKSRQIFIHFDSTDEYELGLGFFDTAKFILMQSEPEKMVVDELPEDILTRITRYLGNIARGDWEKHE